jgi:AmmeMemoRadiSam system protein B/AmmeMemoRadiSam system protein A
VSSTRSFQDQARRPPSSLRSGGETAAGQARRRPCIRRPLPLRQTGLVALALALAPSAGCRAGEPAPAAAPPAPVVRPAAVAGMFYEGDAATLERHVRTLLGRASAHPEYGALAAGVAPHAGYTFSGRCAAALYAHVAGNRYSRVILLAPSHQVAFEGIGLPDPALDAYRMPLGDVPIARDVCRGLAAVEGFRPLPGADAREHAIEVHLPFLQLTAGRFELAPLLCGRVPPDRVPALAAALVPWLGSNTLLIASSDFTHYGPNYGFLPFEKDVPATLHAWLDGAAGRIAALDAAGFGRHCSETGDTIRGETPIRLLLAALGRSGLPLTGRVLATDLSGDVVGDFRNSVSYASIGFFAGGGTNAPAKGGAMIQEHRSGEWTPGLTNGEKATLFAIARDTLDWCVRGSRGAFAFDKYTVTPLMTNDMATFVTLKIRGDLRGCIGTLTAVEPLYLSVHHNAINASLRDPRFDAVSPAELPKLEVDVSVLSPMRPIASLKEFKIGQHGIVLHKGRAGAVYLPEVAAEQGWTVEETLRSLSQKAGLPPDAWRSGAQFEVFESVVLSE